MSGFWSGWVVVLAVVTIGVSLFLFAWGLRVHIPVQDDGTTGHNWDGIREGLHKLPWWWVAVSIGAFAWAIGYLVLYPGLGNFAGVLGWSSPEQHQRDTAANTAKRASQNNPWRAMTIAQLAKDRNAIDVGGRLFQDNCAACHGKGARGNPHVGAPDLTDAVWQFGGSEDAILASILDGRSAVMPPWGQALQKDGVEEVASYLQSLSGNASRDWQVKAGHERYDMFCVSCHGPGGVGRATIAPSLADQTWLYGNDWSDITTSIRDGRTGVMPAWRTRLGVDQSRLVAAWVVAQAAHGRPAGK
ncbi:Cbb3-type cytochrome c oxidase subunit [Lysobacter helvus]|uniref:Cbb3-type cytochrome c oxidase subunit n=2 Tax=Lysobacteraceae TaxID=32033 RepID=A0ABM7Q8F7_9GAMM|nr:MULTISPECIES: cytochrome-c oxidase, cbb3-type subunit III [Lysobacter]BCT93735.1 Cbb3-type cytochrome c oxidase subunit [Lysobacter caseinilyticus]BCT96891.1 Cbb3-type cytochrome c oxidase subunit [Lysobacter helvus]